MKDSDDKPRSHGRTVFHTTRWTMVIRAKGTTPEARLALGELCGIYWTPVFRFLMREGRSEDQSRELTQEFFARILAGDGIDGIDPEKGRFRSYLLGAVKHFLVTTRRMEGRLKRGGGVLLESIDADEENESPALEVPDPSGTMSDAYFDRQWALTVMERGLLTVRSRFQESGKLEQFEILRHWLAGESDHLSKSEAAAKLGLTPGALKVAIHRLRREFRDAICFEIEQTVSHPEAVADELRYLIEVLS